MIGASYQKDMLPALPGMISDTSSYNVDGNCVLDNAGSELLVGLAVKVKEVAADGMKTVTLASADSAYGIAVRSHFMTTGKNGQMVYEPAGGINVLSSGRCWALTNDDAAQTFGTPAKVHTDGKIQKNGAIVTGWTYTGAYLKIDEQTKIAEIQLHQV